MSEHGNGGPAFPTSRDYEEVNPGMTLRDYFAAKASDEDVKAMAHVIRARMVSRHGIGVLPDGWRSEARYMHADAMLAERAK